MKKKIQFVFVNDREMVTKLAQSSSVVKGHQLLPNLDKLQLLDLARFLKQVSWNVTRQTSELFIAKAALQTQSRSTCYRLNKNRSARRSFHRFFIWQTPFFRAAFFGTKAVFNATEFSANSRGINLWREFMFHVSSLGKSLATSANVNSIPIRIENVNCHQMFCFCVLDDHKLAYNA